MICLIDYIYVLATRNITCSFETDFVCGYVIEGEPFRWRLLNGIGVTDGIGPKTDHDNSILGETIIFYLWNVEGFKCNFCILKLGKPPDSAPLPFCPTKPPDGCYWLRLIKGSEVWRVCAESLGPELTLSSEVSFNQNHLFILDICFCHFLNTFDQ